MKDQIAQLDAVARAAAATGQPDTLFKALERATAEAIGHKLFTVLLFHPSNGESERRWTNQPKAYPVGGRKSLNQTFWTQQVLRELRPYIGRSYEDVKSVFFDHELIRSLGCESVLNLPVGYDGKPLGTINLLHEANFYREEHLPVGRVLAQLAAPVLMRLSE
jgi:GAF domain